MNIFPLGLAAAATNFGIIDSISYKFFEPNKDVSSAPTYNVLTTTFQEQTILTRKKSEPYLTIKYSYDNIFDREYQQIEHFIDSVAEDGLNSFIVVDLSKGRKPSSVSVSGGDWVAAIDNTRLFSTVANRKADRAFVHCNKGWKIGDIENIVTNASIKINVDASNYGNLTSTNANTDGIVYPAYTCYLTPNSLTSFKQTVYIDENINTNEDGGWMCSGDLSFRSKYKV